MIKKLLVLSLLCFCFSPSFAQGKKIIGAGGRNSSLTGVVTHQTAETLRRTSYTPGVQFARIINLPDGPLVKLGGSVDNGPAVLAARLLSGAENYRRINAGWNAFPIYLPLALNTEEKSFYRGLRLNSLKAVKNILENGIQVDEVSKETGKRIYFSGYLRRAVVFCTNGKEENLLPTIVRFEVPTWTTVYEHKLLSGYKDYIVHNDIRARYILDVMIFLEVDGKPDWYKVTLENDELVFTRAPSRMFTDEELIRHEFGSRL